MGEQAAEDCLPERQVAGIGRRKSIPSNVDRPFSVWNSQLFTGPDCKSTEHSRGQVNVRVVVEINQ